MNIFGLTIEIAIAKLNVQTLWTPVLRVNYPLSTGVISLETTERPSRPLVKIRHKFTSPISINQKISPVFANSMRLPPPATCTFPSRPDQSVWFLLVADVLRLSLPWVCSWPVIRDPRPHIYSDGEVLLGLFEEIEIALGDLVEWLQMFFFNVLTMTHACLLFEVVDCRLVERKRVMFW